VGQRYTNVRKQTGELNFLWAECIGPTRIRPKAFRKTGLRACARTGGWVRMLRVSTPSTLQRRFRASDSRRTSFCRQARQSARAKRCAMVTPAERMNAPHLPWET
jgi:hypothetical protein